MNIEQKLRYISVVLAAIGFIDALYLTYVKLSHQQVYCGGSGECETVNSSSYAEIGGVPIALLGMGAYIVIMALLFLETRGDFWHANARLIIFGISLIGILYSVYLTYIEIAVLHAICPYCVLSAIVMFLLFVVSTSRLMTDQTNKT
jgi:uncharacterized membrane protein